MDYESLMRCVMGCYITGNRSIELEPPRSRHLLTPTTVSDRDTLCSPILRSGMCAVLNVMHYSSQSSSVNMQEEELACLKHRKQGEDEIYVKLV